MKIALLCGGVSPEREVSLLSGRNITKALRARNYEVIVIDPAYGTNQPGEKELFSVSITREPPKLNGSPLLSSRNYIEAVNNAIPEDVSLAFIALHGTWGEDGKIQSLLEFRGVPYTGSGVLASALAMDKLVSKRIFRQGGIPTAPWIPIRGKFDPDIIRREIDRQFGYPIVVKPVNQGSTVGMTIVQNEQHLNDAVAMALRYSETVLIEMYIAGRELTVSMLGHDPLPVIEICPKEGYYDYKNKYIPGMTEYLVPAPLEEKDAANLQDIARKAFSLLDCKGFGRVDFRYNKAGEPYCLEVNTIPGMTDTSLVPKAAMAVGIEYDELCVRIVKNAVEH